MKKTVSALFTFALWISVFTLSVVQEHEVLGQSAEQPCFPESKDAVNGSPLFCMPYRDLDPFSDLPGEVNQWGRGTVYLHTGDSATGRYLLYNAVGSNLLWLMNNKESGLLVEKSTVKSFSFLSEKDNCLLKYVFFPVNDWYYADGGGAFMEELVRDDLSLYLLHTIEKFPMSDNLKKHRYYFILKRGETKPSRVLSNRKSLCSVLDQSRDFRKHLRSIHLRVNKRDRMIRAVREYNRLY